MAVKSFDSEAFDAGAFDASSPPLPANVRAAEVTSGLLAAEVGGLFVTSTDAGMRVTDES